MSWRDEVDALNKEMARLRKDIAARKVVAEDYPHVVNRLNQQIAMLEWDITPPTSLVDNPRADRKGPSLRHSVRWHKRNYRRTEGLTRTFYEPVTDLYLKTDARDFADAHGVAVPRSFGEWPTPGDIPWDDLPERFVLKSTTGGGGIAVFPLIRQGDSFYDTMARGEVTKDEIIAALYVKHRAVSTYFAEEFLSRVDGQPGSPHDIKVFCFYGEPGFIEMRTEDWGRYANAKVRTRTFLLDGEELFNVRPFVGQATDLDAPRDLEAIIKAARTLSSAIRRPLVRLDFFESDQGLMFGEVTQHPGRLPLLIDSWDEHFGEVYEQGYARMISDVVEQGQLGLVYGDQV